MRIPEIQSKQLISKQLKLESINTVFEQLNNEITTLYKTSFDQLPSTADYSKRVTAFELNMEEFLQTLYEMQRIKLKTEQQQERRKPDIKIQTPNYTLNFYKNKVKDAVRQNKIFTIFGEYYAIRQSLLKRNWIEKCSSDSSKLQQLPFETLSTLATTGNNYETALLSKLLKKFQANFLWRYECYKYKDYDELELPYCNRIERSDYLNFTSKLGLIACIQLSEINFSSILAPQCYRLTNNDEYKQFLDIYRTTYCLSLLKFINEHSNNMDLFNEAGKIPLTTIQFAIVRIFKHIQIQQHKLRKHSVYKDWSSFYRAVDKIINRTDKFCSFDKLCSKRFILRISCILKEAKKYWPRYDSEGYNNLWIVKPAKCCQGFGIIVENDINGIMTFVENNAKRTYMVQKYIERPHLIYNTKFDIRQYIILTITEKAIQIWIYKDCYLKFSSQQFSLRDLHSSIHLTNYTIQKNYKNGYRSNKLPPCNMWSLDQFQSYLNEQNQGDIWNKLIFPQMKKSIIGVILASLIEINLVPKTFELYGCDFLIDLNFTPILLEINSSPDMSHSTIVTAKICPRTLEDVIKVVIDYSNNPQSDTGQFECIFAIDRTELKNAVLEMENFESQIFNKSFEISETKRKNRKRKSVDIDKENVSHGKSLSLKREDGEKQENNSDESFDEDEDETSNENSRNKRLSIISKLFDVDEEDGFDNKRNSQQKQKTNSSKWFEDERMAFLRKTSPKGRKTITNKWFDAIEEIAGDAGDETLSPREKSGGKPKQNSSKLFDEDEENFKTDKESIFNHITPRKNNRKKRKPIASKSFDKDEKYSSDDITRNPKRRKTITKKGFDKDEEIIGDKTISPRKKSEGKPKINTSILLEKDKEDLTSGNTKKLENTKKSSEEDGKDISDDRTLPRRNEEEDNYDEALPPKNKYRKLKVKSNDKVKKTPHRNHIINRCRKRKINSNELFDGDGENFSGVMASSPRKNCRKKRKTRTKKRFNEDEEISVDKTISSRIRSGGKPKINTSILLKKDKEDMTSDSKNISVHSKTFSFTKINHWKEGKANSKKSSEEDGKDISDDSTSPGRNGRKTLKTITNKSLEKDKEDNNDEALPPRKKYRKLKIKSNDKVKKTLIKTPHRNHRIKRCRKRKINSIELIDKDGKDLYDDRASSPRKDLCKKRKSIATKSSNKSERDISDEISFIEDEEKIHGENRLKT